MESSDPELLGKTIEFDLNDKGWDALAECLQKLSDAWESRLATDEGNKDEAEDVEAETLLPPNLSDFLPTSNEALRSVALIELIKLDMEYRSRDKSLWKQLEDFGAEFPEVHAGERLPPDLVYEEFQLRKKMDGQVSVEEYQQRFPEEFGSLTRLINEDTRETSALFKPGTAVSFEVGDRVDDFDLLTRLGKGAFATVFLARQNSMQRIVALKVSADQGHEPQMLAQLDHPHIVRVYDQRVITEPPARLMYMQHVAGGTLQEAFSEARRIADGEELSGKHLVAAIDHLLNLRGESIPVKSENRRRMAKSTWDQVVSQVGNEIAQALAYAHERDVLHRDLKPANVLLDKDCHVKLVDFNISFCSKLDGATPAAYFGGSMAYMSPEQLEACSPEHDRTPDELDGRSDLFSVGVMLFELLVGCRPFEDHMDASDWSASMQKMIDDRRGGIPHESLEKLKPYSTVLANAITRCLKGKQPERFSDGHTLQQNLAWSRNPLSDQLFEERSHPILKFVNRTPFFTIGIVTLGMSAVTAGFLIAYNLHNSVPRITADKLDGERLLPIIDRVASMLRQDVKNDTGAFWKSGDGFFVKCMMFVNGSLFPLGALYVYCITRPVSRCLRSIRNGTPLSADEVELGIDRNVKLGKMCAVMATIIWTIGGAMFPIAFGMFGYEINGEKTFHFISSHFLNGMIVGAYSFWLVTLCALHVWQPRLLEAALATDSKLDWTAEHDWLERLSGFFHILAVAIPITAIAWIVLFSKSETDEASLTVLSIVALAGLVLLVWTSKGVKRCLTVQQTFDPAPDDF